MKAIDIFLKLTRKKFPNNKIIYEYNREEDLHFFIHDIDLTNNINYAIIYMLIENVLYYNKIYNIAFYKE